jgi:guanylate kinase
VTTRKPRKNEINGIDYIFTTVEDFKKKISNNEFLEYADVFNNKYGTLISSTKLLADKGYDVLFDIDWQGTQQLSQVEENILTIFILPPSKKEIEKRLKKRESENLENSNIVKDRMLKFEDELSHWKEYDYVVTNDNFDNCVKEIANIINVERIKRANKKSIITKIRDLKD